MPRSNALNVVNKMCENRVCMSEHDVERLGSSEQAISKFVDRCGIRVTWFYVVKYFCPENAFVPTEILALKHAVEYALERARGGYASIYKSFFKDLPDRARFRALQILSAWAKESGCVKFKKFYKCPEDAVKRLNKDIEEFIAEVRGDFSREAEVFLDVVKDALE